MKQLKDIISEKLIINKYSKVKNNKLKDPEIGEIAYDYNSGLWEIIDYCDLEDKRDLNDLIKHYDQSGCFKDFLDEFNKENYSDVKYAVAAISEEDGEPAIWLWGYDGLCFENKPKNKK